jgi:hypothetical protein
MTQIDAKQIDARVADATSTCVATLVGVNPTVDYSLSALKNVEILMNSNEIVTFGSSSHSILSARLPSKFGMASISWPKY